MKATLNGKIISVQNTEGDSILTFKSTGKVDGTGFGPGSSDARKTSLDGTVELKAIIAKEMKIGAVLTITISDEDEDEDERVD